MPRLWVSLNPTDYSTCRGHQLLRGPLDTAVHLKMATAQHVLLQRETTLDLDLYLPAAPTAAAATAGEADVGATVSVEPGLTSPSTRKRRHCEDEGQQTEKESEEDQEEGAEDGQQKKKRRRGRPKGSAKKPQQPSKQTIEQMQQGVAMTLGNQESLQSFLVASRVQQAKLYAAQPGRKKKEVKGTQGDTEVGKMPAPARKGPWAPTASVPKVRVQHRIADGRDRTNIVSLEKLHESH